MKKRYTRKQISEAIQYWKSELKKMDEGYSANAAMAGHYGASTQSVQSLATCKSQVCDAVMSQVIGAAGVDAVPLKTEVDVYPADPSKINLNHDSPFMFVVSEGEKRILVFNDPRNEKFVKDFEFASDAELDRWFQSYGKQYGFSKDIHFPFRSLFR